MIGCSSSAEVSSKTPQSQTPQSQGKGRKRKARVSKRSKCYRVGTVLRGQGVWYGGKHHGGATASGERFDKNAMTAAHKTLPFNTVVRVTNTRNKRSVQVRVNDRGPYGKKSRIIDVSEAAARKLDMISSGVVPVQVEVVKMPPGKRGRCR